MSRRLLEAHLDGDCGGCVYCDREEAHDLARVDSSEEQEEDEDLPASQADEGVTRP